MNYYDIKQLAEDPNTCEKLKYHCTQFIKRTDFMLKWYFADQMRGRFDVIDARIKHHYEQIQLTTNPNKLKV